MKRLRLILIWLLCIYTALFWAGATYDTVSVMRHWHRLLGYVSPVDAGLDETHRAQLEHAIVRAKISGNAGDYLNGWINYQSILCNADGGGRFILQSVRSRNIRHSLALILIRLFAPQSDQWKITLGWMPYLDKDGHFGRGFDKGAIAMFGKPASSLTEDQIIERLLMGRSPYFYMRKHKSQHP